MPTKTKQKKNYFQDTLGTSTPIIELLKVTEVRNEKICKAQVTNHSSSELENKGHVCYFAVGAWLSNFCHGFKYGVSTKTEKSFENRGRR